MARRVTPGTEPRVVVIAALVAVIALSWAYLLAGAGVGMSPLETARMPDGGMAAAVSGSDTLPHGPASAWSR